MCADRLGKGAHPTGWQPRSKRRWTLLDKFYEVGVIVKGIDGAIELAVGIVLLVAPSMPHHALVAVAAEAGEGMDPFRQFIANYLENLDDQLAHTGLGFLIAFLLVHGLVKLALVYFLLRRIHRAYPYALAVLTAFLLYQLYTLATAPTVGMAVLTVIDLAIIVLVYKEYREIKPPGSKTGAVAN